MNYEELIEIGFNKNEAKVYISLARFGKADANQLIKTTKFHKNIVYDNLDKLIDKGLVTFIIEDGKRSYSIAPPNMLVEFFEEKQEELQKKKEKAKKISEKIKKIPKSLVHKQQATIYKGVKGIRSFYNELIEIKKEYVMFGAPQASIDIMGDSFWQNFETKRSAKKIKARLLFNESIRGYGESILRPFTELRYFSEDFEPMTETNIQGDRVAIIVWSEEPILFLIQDKHVAESYKSYFEDLWKRSKK